jgi:hypothetical protein
MAFILVILTVAIILPVSRLIAVMGSPAIIVGGIMGSTSSHQRTKAKGKLLALYNPQLTYGPAFIAMTACP